MFANPFRRPRMVRIAIDNRCVIRPGDLVLVSTEGVRASDVRAAIEPALPAGARLLIRVGDGSPVFNLSWLAEQLVGQRGGHAGSSTQREHQSPDRQADAAQPRVGQVGPIALAVDDGSAMPKPSQETLTNPHCSALPSPEGSSVSPLRPSQTDTDREIPMETRLTFDRPGGLRLVVKCSIHDVTAILSPAQSPCSFIAYACANRARCRVRDVGAYSERALWIGDASFDLSAAESARIIAIGVRDEAALPQPVQVAA